MALSLTTNFVGQASTNFISAALFGIEAIEKKLIIPVPNVKYKIAIPRIDFDNLIQSDSAAWTTGGTLTYTEQYLTPVKNKVNFEYPIFNWESSWQSAQMTAGALNGTIGTDLASYINNQMIKQVANQMNLAVWQGQWTGSTTAFTASNAGSVVGILKRMDDSSTIVRVAATAITVANVIDCLTAVYNAIPNVVKPNAVIVMNHTDLGKYKLKVSAGNTAANYTGTYDNYFNGVPVIGQQGVPVNTMAAFNPATSNYMGTDLLADYNEIKLLDMRDLDGSDYFRYKMRFTCDTNISYGAEAVLYK